MPPRHRFLLSKLSCGELFSRDEKVRPPRASVSSAVALAGPAIAARSARELAVTFDDLPGVSVAGESGESALAALRRMTREARRRSRRRARARRRVRQRGQARSVRRAGPGRASRCFELARRGSRARQPHVQPLRLPPRPPRAVRGGRRRAGSRSRGHCLRFAEAASAGSGIPSCTRERVWKTSGRSRNSSPPAATGSRP